MKRHVVVGVVIAGTVGAAGFAARSFAQAPAPTCLHAENESADQRARRAEALGFVRHINNLQASAFPANNAYQPAEGLALTQALPSGFQFRLTTNGEAYAYSVRDTTDPCLFTYFGDEGGVIYRGEAIRQGRS